MNGELEFTEPGYEKLRQIPITREVMDDDKHFATYNPLGLIGSGYSKEDADKDLEYYLLDLFDSLLAMDDSKLGFKLRENKNHLKGIIRRVS